VAQFVLGASPAKYMTAGSIMTEDPAMIRESESAREALQALQSHDSSIGFLVNEAGQLRGLVPVTRLVNISSNGAGVPWSDIMSEAPTANQNSPLEDILEDAIQNAHPLAVVDDSGKLLGEISQGTLLQVLAADLDETDATQEEVETANS
jgi:glycine betaine/proline transport system ATP-binding protein